MVIAVGAYTCTSVRLCERIERGGGEISFLIGHIKANKGAGTYMTVFWLPLQLVKFNQLTADSKPNVSPHMCSTTGRVRHLFAIVEARMMDLLHVHCAFHELHEHDTAPPINPVHVCVRTALNFVMD